jgi:hypothetical protein
VNDGGMLQCPAEIQSSITFFLLEFEKFWRLMGRKFSPLSFHLGSLLLKTSTRLIPNY